MPRGIQDTGRRITDPVQDANRRLPSAVAGTAFLSGALDRNSGTWLYRPIAHSADEGSRRGVRAALWRER